MEDKLATASNKPEVGELKTELSRSITHITDVTELDDIRFARWAGQTKDGRKHSAALPEGQAAFPFENASDTRILLADGIIRQLTEMLVGAHHRAICRVNGVEANDMGGGTAAATVVNWARKRMHNQLGREASLLANYQEGYGYALAMVSWEQQVSLKEQVISLDDIIELATQAEGGSPLATLPEMIADPASEKEVADMLSQTFNQLKKRDVRKIVKDLREEGQAAFPMPYICRNQPMISALKPNEDFVVPPETIEIQDARVVFRRQFLTEAELRSKIASEGWDEKFVDEAVNTAGTSAKPSLDVDLINDLASQDNLIEVWWAYHRAVDDNNVPAIYYTIFSPQVQDDIHALHKMLPYAHNQYPFIEFKAEEFARRLTESRSVSEVVATWQNEVKTQRDSTVDYTSFATLPAIQFLKRNGPVNKFGPAVQIPVTKIDDVKFMMPPPREPTIAINLEATVEKQVAKYFSLPHPEIPPSATTIGQQHKVSTWLRGWTEIYRQVFRLCIQYLDPAELQRITNAEEAQLLTHEAEKFDFILTFNADELNYDLTKEKMQTISTAIVPLDTTGRIDRGKFIDKLLRSVIPEAADELLVDEAQATKRLYDGVKSDIVEMMLGMEVDYTDASNDPTSSAKLQIANGLAQKTPAIQQRIQGDQVFQELWNNYIQNLNMGVQQQQNKQIGRQGVATVQGQGPAQ
jgi:hypothetical protein